MRTRARNLFIHLIAINYSSVQMFYTPKPLSTWVCGYSNQFHKFVKKNRLFGHVLLFCSIEVRNDRFNFQAKKSRFLRYSRRKFPMNGEKNGCFLNRRCQIVRMLLSQPSSGLGILPRWAKEKQNRRNISQFSDETQFDHTVFFRLTNVKRTCKNRLLNLEFCETKLKFC